MKPTAIFCANLKKAIFNRETVTLGGGDFVREELQDVLATLEDDAPVTGNVKTFTANLAKAIFDRETVTIAGGQFQREELTPVLNALKAASRA